MQIYDNKENHVSKIKELGLEDWKASRYGGYLLGWLFENRLLKKKYYDEVLMTKYNGDFVQIYDKHFGGKLTDSMLTEKGQKFVEKYLPQIYEKDCILICEEYKSLNNIETDTTPTIYQVDDYQLVGEYINDSYSEILNPATLWSFVKASFRLVLSFSVTTSLLMTLFFAIDTVKSISDFVLTIIVGFTLFLGGSFLFWSVFIGIPFFLVLWFGNRKLKDRVSLKSQSKKSHVERDIVVEKYKKRILATEREFIKIEAEPVHKKLELWESKFGGDPYWPSDKDYPVGTNGVKMQMIAQIDLSEIPQHQLLPSKGILQFFIIQDKKAMYGLNEGTCKVVYHEDIVKDSDRLLNDFSFVPNPAQTSPVQREMKLSFIKKREHMSLQDYRFDTDVADENFAEDIDYDENWLLSRHKLDVRGTGHKLLGYPSFTQFDPRGPWLGEGEDAEPYELLLQIESQPGFHRYDIIWGDAGSGGFYIKYSDLIKKDFSRVKIHWDCY